MNLYGARWVMAPSVQSSESDRGRFNHYMNQIGVLYDQYPEVLNALKAYRANGTNSNFGSLIRALCAASGVTVDHLTNDDVEGVLTAKLPSEARPAQA